MQILPNDPPQAVLPVEIELTVRPAMTVHLVTADHVAAETAARAVSGLAATDLKLLRTMTAEVFAGTVAVAATDSAVVALAEVAESIAEAARAAPGLRRRSRSIAPHPASRQQKERFPAGSIQRATADSSDSP